MCCLVHLNILSTVGARIQCSILRSDMGNLSHKIAIGTCPVPLTTAMGVSMSLTQIICGPCQRSKVKEQFHLQVVKAQLTCLPQDHSWLMPLALRGLRTAIPKHKSLSNLTPAWHPLLEGYIRLQTTLLCCKNKTILCLLISTIFRLIMPARKTKGICIVVRLH